MFNGIDDDDDIDPFTQPDWGVGRAKNTPAAIARSLFRARGINASAFERKLNLWAKHLSANEKHRSSTKSNVLRAAKKDYMSWGTLLRVIGILRLKDIDFYAVVHWEDGVETTSKHVINGDANYLAVTDAGNELIANQFDATYENALKPSDDELMQAMKLLVEEFRATGRDVDVVLDGVILDLD